MPSPYEKDFRQTILSAIEREGLSYSQAATRFRVSRRWIGTLVRRFKRTGSSEPLSWGEGPSPVLGAREQAWISDWLRAAPLTTQASLVARLAEQGVHVSLFTVARTLKRMRWSRGRNGWAPPAPVAEPESAHARAS